MFCDASKLCMSRSLKQPALMPFCIGSLLRLLKPRQLVGAWCFSPKVSRSCLWTSEVSKSYLNGHKSFSSTSEWMLLPHTCKPFIQVDALTPTGTLPILSAFPFLPPLSPHVLTKSLSPARTDQNRTKNLCSILDQHSSATKQNKYHLLISFVFSCLFGALLDQLKRNSRRSAKGYAELIAAFTYITRPCCIIQV